MSLPAENTYDVILIGARPIGYTAAGCARAAGLSVAAVNGTCSGPSAPTGPASRARRCSAPSPRSPGPAGSPGRARRSPRRWILRGLARRDGWVTGWNDEGQAAGLKGLGAELIRGHGRLDGHRRVAVATLDGETVALTARHAVVLCTGPARTGRPGRGATVDQPARHRLPHRARTAGHRRRRRGRRGNGQRVAGLGCRGHPAGQDDGLLPGWSRSPGNWSAAPWPRPEWTSGSASPSPRCAVRRHRAGHRDPGGRRRGGGRRGAVRHRPGPAHRRHRPGHRGPGPRVLAGGRRHLPGPARRSGPVEARTPSPRTTGRCRRCSSATLRPAPSASPPTRPNTPGTASASSTSTSASRYPGRACTPTATPAAPAWSSTRTTTTCPASPSSAPAWKN